MTEKYDVLVVGAGPGGSAAAKKCMDTGLKTLLIDRHKLPRRKACSGIISNSAQNYILENFGPIPEKVYGSPYISRGMAFYLPSVGTFFTDVDCYNLYVWRDKFDHFLAKSSKAELWERTRFVNLEFKGDQIEAELEKTERGRRSSVKIAAKYLIGADGSNSHVVRSFAPETYAGMPWAFGIQKYYEGTVDADDRYLYWFLEKGMGPFPWLNLKDGQIIIGLAAMVGEKFYPKFNKLLDFLKKNFGLEIKKEIAKEGCLANTMTPLNRFFPGRGRVLMVGDAMGLMHQGHEGISCAMASGGYAGQAITEALNNGIDALSRYKELVRPEMEMALDQFNPLRMRDTTASDTSRQPSLLHGFSNAEKVKAAIDAVSFIKAEFSAVTGIGPTVFKNMVHRLIHGRYHIPSVD